MCHFLNAFVHSGCRQSITLINFALGVELRYSISTKRWVLGMYLLIPRVCRSKSAPPWCNANALLSENFS